MVDYTQLSTFLSCPRKYRNRYIHGLRLIKDEEGLNLDKDFGIAGHTCLERFYSKKDYQIDPWSSFTDYPNAKYGKVKTRANGISIIKDYIDNYRQQDRNWVVLGTEVTD